MTKLKEYDEIENVMKALLLNRYYVPLHLGRAVVPHKCQNQTALFFLYLQDGSTSASLLHVYYVGMTVFLYSSSVSDFKTNAL